MAYLIDSSVFIELERLHQSTREIAKRAGDDPIYLAAITASELLHGVHRADTAVRRGRRETFVASVLDSVPILPFDLETARVHARAWVDLRSRGVHIGPHDLIIAATALQCDLTVLTHNERDFRRVPDLHVSIW